jgi:hypothetical protein
MTDLRPELVDRLGPRVARATRITERRYALEVRAETPPNALLAELVASGGRLVSLNPIRATLEDYFVERVAAEKATRADQAT